MVQVVDPVGRGRGNRSDHDGGAGQGPMPRGMRTARTPAATSVETRDRQPPSAGGTTPPGASWVVPVVAPGSQPSAQDAKPPSRDSTRSPSTVRLAQEPRELTRAARRVIQRLCSSSTLRAELDDGRTRVAPAVPGPCSADHAGRSPDHETFAAWAASSRPTALLTRHPTAPIGSASRRASTPRSIGLSRADWSAADPDRSRFPGHRPAVTSAVTVRCDRPP